MPQAAYPTVAQIIAQIEAEGLTSPGETIVTRHRAAAISEFERGTGYTPFLGDGVETVKTYDPPVVDNLVRFGGGFYTVTDVEWSGRDLTEDVDYILLPGDGVHNRMELLCGGVGTRKSIEVTGNRGYAEALPDDVFEAILLRAVSLAIRAGTPGALIGGASVKQGDITVSGASNGSSSKAKDYDAYFAQVIANYLNVWH